MEKQPNFAQLEHNLSYTSST
uniref:Uncharacterized protein n=1 Tax=Rhizophora mucronata TaxID=61149 RepID=A0A2P2NZ86_RHIMU